MNRAIRWLVLVMFIAGGAVLYDGAVHAQGGVSASIVCSQYLRSEPSEDAPRVGLMNPGETHTAVGRYGVWLYLQIDTNLQGWAFDGSCLNVNGDFNSLPVLHPSQLDLAALSGPPSATLLCTQYLRRSPGANAEAMMILTNADTPLTIGGRTADNAWMLVTTTGGQVGWTATGTDCLSVSGNFSAVPVVDAAVYNGPPAVDVLCSQYVRAQPDQEAPRVAIMQPSDDLWMINGRDASANWLQVTNADGGFTGWTAVGQCISVLGNYSSIPVITGETVSASAAPVGSMVCTQNLRAFPSSDGRRVAVLDVSTGVVEILGRTADISWVYIRTNSGLEGWLASGNCLAVQGNLFNAPERVVEGYSGPPIIQIACSQYLRATPSANASRIAILQPRDGPLDVVGRSENGDWVFVQLPDGTGGWTANAACVGVLGNVMEAPVILAGAGGTAVASSPPTARIQCSQYLRTEPSMGAARLAIMQPGDGVYDVTGRSEDGSWLYLGQQDGFQGWAAWGSCLDVQGNIYGLPVVESGIAFGAPVASVVCTQYLRTGPDMTYSTLDVMSVGTITRILARDEAGAWFLVQKDDGTQGWTAWGDCLNIQGSALSVPVVDSGEYVGPTVATASCSQFLREYPDNAANPLVVLNGNEGVLSVTGRTADHRWMQIVLEDGTVGWAATGICLNILGDFYTLPEVAVELPEQLSASSVTVYCSQYLRALPSRTAPVVMIINGVEGTLTITGRTENSHWMQIMLENGTVGWAEAGACLGVEGRLSDAPVLFFEGTSTTPYSGPAVLTLSCSQYMREYPWLESAEVDILYPGDGVLSILGRNGDASWLFIQNPEGNTGWVANAACVETLGDIGGLPVQEVVVDAGPPVVDIVCNTNLRRNPSLDSERMMVLTSRSDLFNVIGRDDDTNWVLIEGGSGLVGWVSLAECVVPDGNLLSVPVPAGPRDPNLWNVLRAEGSCTGTDQASQIIAAYNRTGPIGAVSRECTTDALGIQALTRFEVEIAIVNGTCPGFQTVHLSGGQTLCHRFLRTSQLDDFMAYASGQ